MGWCASLWWALLLCTLLSSATPRHHDEPRANATSGTTLNVALLRQVRQLRAENQRLAALYQRCRESATSAERCSCGRGYRAVSHGAGNMLNKSAQVELEEGKPSGARPAPGNGSVPQVAATSPHKNTTEAGLDDQALVRLREIYLRALPSARHRKIMERKLDSMKSPCTWRDITCKSGRVVHIKFRFMVTQEMVDATTWFPNLRVLTMVSVRVPPRLDFRPCGVRSIRLSVKQGGAPAGCRILGLPKKGLNGFRLWQFHDAQANVTVDWGQAGPISVVRMNWGSPAFQGFDRASVVQVYIIHKDIHGHSTGADLTIPTLPRSVKDLHLANNGSPVLVHRGAMRWGDMKALRKIKVNHVCPSEDFWDGLERAPALTSVSVGVLKLDDRMKNSTLPSALTSYSGLKMFHFYLPPGSGWTMPRVPSVSTLRYLALHGFNLTRAPANLGNASTLVTLKMTHCGLTEVPEDVEQLKQLEYLSVRDNYISRVSPAIETMIKRGSPRIIIDGNPYANAGLEPVQRLAGVLARYFQGISQVRIRKAVDICTAVLLIDQDIACDPVTGDMISVVLPYLSMGRIPIELLPFAPTIRVLNVRGNGISEFPAELALALVNLVVLDVSDNMLKEAPDLSNMKKLKKLHMSDNLLRNLTSLHLPNTIEEVDVSGNQLTKLPSTVFLHTPNLGKLIASKNSLTEVPKDLSSLISLTLLDVTHNKLTSEGVDGLITAKTVRYQNRTLDASFNPGITRFPKLARLDKWNKIRFTDCAIDNADGEWEFNNAASVILENNRFTSFPQSLISGHYYNYLNLAGNQIRAFDMDSWASSGITWLNMSRNSLEDTVALTIAPGEAAGREGGGVKKITQRNLDLSFNNLSSVSESFSVIFSQFTKWGYLDLMGNNIHDFTHFSFTSQTTVRISDYSLRHVDPMVTEDESKELLKFLRSGKEADAALETFPLLSQKIRNLTGDFIGKRVSYEYYVDSPLNDPLQNCDVWGLKNNGKKIELATCYCEGSLYRDPLDLNRCRACPDAAVCTMDELTCNRGFHARLVGGDVGDDEANFACDVCPQGAVCNGLTVVPKPGYWKSSEDSSEVHSCSNPKACAGGESSECNAGYSGVVCGECTSGYFADAAHSCTKCPEPHISIIFFSLAVLGMVAMAFAFFAAAASLLQKRHAKGIKRDNRMMKLKAMLSDVRGSMSTSLKVGVGFLQVITSLDVTFDLEWPSCINILDGIFGWVNLDLMRATSLECVWELVSFHSNASASETVESAGFGYGHKMVLSSLIPMGATVCLIACYWGMRAAMKVQLIRRNMRINLVAFKETCTHCNLLVWQLSYLPLSYRAIQFFNCVSFDDGETFYIHYDLSTRCYDASYWQFASAAFVTVVVCTLGMPLFIVLYALARRKVIHDETKVGPLIHIYRPYKKEYVYWEALEMIRKTIVGGAVVILSGSSTFQVTVAMAVMFAFTVAHFYCLPSSNHVSNLIQGAMLCLTYFTMSLGILRTLQVPGEQRDIFSAVVIGLDILVISAIMGLLTYDSAHVMYEQIQIFIGRVKFLVKKARREETK